MQATDKFKTVGDSHSIEDINRNIQLTNSGLTNLKKVKNYLEKASEKLDYLNDFRKNNLNPRDLDSELSIVCSLLGEASRLHPRGTEIKNLLRLPGVMLSPFAG